MDRHASTIKRFRQSLKRRAHNRTQKSVIKSNIRKVQEASTHEEALAALGAVKKNLDKSAGKNLIHANKAARLKSRLTRFVSSRFAK